MKAKSLIREAQAILDTITQDAVPTTGTSTPSVGNDEEMLIASASAPPMSTTKGSRRKKLVGVENLPEPHRRREDGKKRTRRCSRCLKKDGHYASTCTNPPVIQEKRPRGRPKVGTTNGRNAAVDVTTESEQYESNGCEDASESDY